MTQEGILLTQTIVISVQTIILGLTGYYVYKYTNETQKLREETAEQSRIMWKQLRIQSERKLVLTAEEDVLPPDYSVMAVMIHVVNASRQTITIAKSYLVLGDKILANLRKKELDKLEQVKIEYATASFFWIASDTLAKVLKKQGYSTEVKLRAVVEDILGKKYKSKDFMFDPSFWFPNET